MTPIQCKMARVAVDWGVRELARAAATSPDTIARLERGDQLKSSTIATVRAALESAGVDFVEENGSGPGARRIKEFPTLRDDGGPGLKFSFPFTPDVEYAVGDRSMTREASTLDCFVSSAVMSKAGADAGSRGDEIFWFQANRRRLKTAGLRAYKASTEEDPPRRRKNSYFVISAADLA
jgi:transcriptional regulator with XRE-family HTH domain